MQLTLTVCHYEAIKIELGVRQTFCYYIIVA